MTTAHLTTRHAVPLVLLLGLSQAGCAGARAERGAAVAASSPAAADPGIETALRAMNDVCARRDLAGFMALFEDSDDIALVGSDAGEVFEGREAVAGFMRKLFALPFTFSFEMPKPLIHQRGDLAWVFVDGAMVHTTVDGRSRKMPYRITAVLVRRASGWRWQLFSGSSPRPE